MGAVITKPNTLSYFILSLSYTHSLPDKWHLTYLRVKRVTSIALVECRIMKRVIQLRAQESVFYVALTDFLL